MPGEIAQKRVFAARTPLMAGAALLLLAAPGAAQEAGSVIQPLADLIGGTAEGGAEGAALSGRIIQIIALITVLSVAPGLLIMMTSFKFDR